ncbi:hypothetical protein [Sphingomonas sp.]|uniref:hypothetical protein n=1 Tax=Sphingomonas sp. TaxID=28214 RepID=UPI00257A2BFF|nr:hypothetical protein [Sphingomonas sp.]
MTDQLLKITELNVFADKVYNALVDPEAQDRWKPNFNISGFVTVDDYGTCRFKVLPHRAEMTASVRIVQLEPSRSISWRMGSRRLFAIEERFEIQSEGRRSVLRHEFAVLGVLSPLIRRLTDKQIRTYLKTTSDALARFCNRASIRAEASGSAPSAARRRRQS